MKPESVPMMRRKILIYPADISDQSDDLVLAVLENEALVSFKKILSEKEDHLGDIRLGKIARIQKNLSAAFVDIGEEKQAFLPLTEEKLDQYKNGQEIIVELKKAAVGNKGMAVTDQFSLRSAHVVLSHGNTLIGVSKKIVSEKERIRLKSIGYQLPRPENVGYVLRTESNGCSEEVLHAEAVKLLQVYERILDKARFSRVGETLYRAESSLSAALMEISSLSDQDEIMIEGKEILRRMTDELMVKGVQLPCSIRSYEPNGFSLSALYKVETQLEEAMRKRVNLSGGILHGGYLFIEETEALCVIDVNSGKELSGNSKEEAVTAFNAACCEPIARQIRLRNLSGIILIDFIDMELEEDRAFVLETMKQAMSQDTRVHTVVDFTKLNLLEMTRARKGLSLSGK